MPPSVRYIGIDASPRLLARERARFARRDAYINGLSEHGFRIDRIAELPAYPGVEKRGPRAAAENRANREIPLFLALRARRG